MLSYLDKGARAIGKESLPTRINVIEDVENNIPLKEAMKTRFRELRRNLKRKAEEKINSLMRGSGYKVSAKMSGLQFLLGNLDTRIATRTSLLRKCRRSRKRKSSKSSVRRKNTKSTKNKKKIQAVRRKTKKASATKRCRVKKRNVSDIFS